MRHSVALLAVIGPHWVDIVTPDGQRRLDDPGDLVRLEIETALTQGIPMIPLLVQNAAMPTATRLPPSLQPLATRNGLAVRYDPDFVWLDQSRISVTTMGCSAPRTKS